MGTKYPLFGIYVIPIRLNVMWLPATHGVAGGAPYPFLTKFGCKITMQETNGKYLKVVNMKKSLESRLVNNGFSPSTARFMKVQHRSVVAFVGKYVLSRRIGA